MSLGAIDNVIADLRKLRSLMGGCSDVDLAMRYLKKMKRPRADKQAEGRCGRREDHGAQHGAVIRARAL
jgi:hypothetical protein